jgi:TonB family protein
MGTVLLRATFNSDGTITDIEVVMPVDFMNESAVEALRRSTFQPATINGVPVTVRRVLIKEAIHY